MGKARAWAVTPPPLLVDSAKPSLSLCLPLFALPGSDAADETRRRILVLCSFYRPRPRRRPVSKP